MSQQLFRNISQLATLKLALNKKSKGRMDEKDLSIIKNAAMIVESGQIKWVGKEKDVTKALFKKLNVDVKKLKSVDLKGQTVIPGFLECHTHLIFAGDRSDEFELRNTGVSYQEIARRGGGILSTVKHTKKAAVDELLHLAQARVDRFVAQGVTTVEVKSGYCLDKKNELKMLEVAGRLKKAQVIATYLGPHAVPKEFESSSKYIDKIIDDILPAVKEQGIAKRVDMFVEKGYFDLVDAKRYYEKAKALGFELTGHCDQLNAFGAAMSVSQLGAHSVDHLVQLPDSEIKKLSKSETTCVLLPGADFYLKMAYPKARDLIDHQARVAIATDFNPGSCPTQDLSFMGVLSRLEMKMSLPEVIVAYTLGAAYALGVEKSQGVILPGFEANFAVLSDDWRALFYQVGYHPVQETWRQGRRIFHKR